MSDYEDYEEDIELEIEPDIEDTIYVDEETDE